MRRKVESFTKRRLFGRQATRLLTEVAREVNIGQYNIRYVNTRVGYSQFRSNIGIFRPILNQTTWKLTKDAALLCEGATWGARHTAIHTLHINNIDNTAANPENPQHLFAWLDRQSGEQAGVQVGELDLTAQDPEITSTRNTRQLATAPTQC